MLLDLIQPSNQSSFNIKLAHTIGLQASIYCNELLNIIGQAKKKNKIDQDGYFVLDRKYMFQRTTIALEDQLNIDASLAKINLIAKKDVNTLALDIQLLGDIIASEDLSVKEDLIKRTKLKTSKEVKESKTQAIIKALQNNISINSEPLNKALCDWIESIYATGKVLSKAAVKAFEKTLLEYANGDLEVAKRVVQIATIQGYKDCNWAINLYERDKINKTKNRTNILTRVTTDQFAKKGALSSEIY